MINTLYPQKIRKSYKNHKEILKRGQLYGLSAVHFAFVFCAEIIEVSKRLFGVPNFVYYAVADGIFEILKTVRSGIGRFFSLPDNDGQLSLFSCCEVSRLNFGES